MLTYERLNEKLKYNPATGIFTWKIPSKKCKIDSVAGEIRKDGRRYIGIDYKTYLASRLAWFIYYGEWPKNQVDHKNTDRSDDRIDNLRDATQSQNNANTNLRDLNTSGYKGVTWHSAKNKWQAQIKANNKYRYLGIYRTAEEAHEAYKKAAIDIFAEFARTE